FRPGLAGENCLRRSFRSREILPGDNRSTRLITFLARSSPGQKNRVIVLLGSGISRIGSRLTFIDSFVICYASLYQNVNLLSQTAGFSRCPWLSRGRAESCDGLVEHSGGATARP